MKALVIDTETTGLIDNRSVALDKLPEVIEYCGLLVDFAKKGRVLGSLDTLIRPRTDLGIAIGGRGDKTTTQITGLTSDDLKSAPAFAEVADKIAHQIETSPVVIAQNASFDREVIDVEFERLGRKIEWPRLICTVEQTIHLKGHRLNLGDLHELLTGERFPGAHRARVDTEALVRCCVALFKRGDL